MAIVTLMPYSWMEEWENERVMKRGDDYDSIKKTFGHKAVEQACQLFPSIRVSSVVIVYIQKAVMCFHKVNLVFLV